MKIQKLDINKDYVAINEAFTVKRECFYIPYEDNKDIYILESLVNNTSFDFGLNDNEVVAHPRNLERAIRKREGNLLKPIDDILLKPEGYNLNTVCLYDNTNDSMIIIDEEIYNYFKDMIYCGTCVAYDDTNTSYLVYDVKFYTSKSSVSDVIAKGVIDISDHKDDIESNNSTKEVFLGNIKPIDTPESCYIRYQSIIEKIKTSEQG